MKLSGDARNQVAGLLWIAIGGWLAFRGWKHWDEFGAGPLPWVALAIGLVIGAAKGWFVIRKSAARVRARNEKHPEPRWIWDMYPVYLYLVIPLMIGLGFWFRTQFGAEHPSWVLAVYGGIGAALVLSSVAFFTRRRG